MRLHSMQHVPFEDTANIGRWAMGKGHRLTRTLLFKDETLPSVEDVDWLIIMGGPMNIYEEEKYPWLTREKKFIERAMTQRKIILGVCLGAQLIADVLGARVFRNPHKEIGWFPVSLTREAKRSAIFGRLPERFTAFHWHGDTFELAPGATRMAESDGCLNQAFEADGRVIGLQFHLESSRESIEALIRNCGDELVPGTYIQPARDIFSQDHHLSGLTPVLNILLEAMEEARPKKT